MLAGRAIELLGFPRNLIAPALERLAQDERIRPELIPLDQGQPGSGQSVCGSPGRVRLAGDLPDPALLWRKRRGRTLESPGAAAPSSRRHRSSFPGRNLSEQQQPPCRWRLSHPVSILTGGPGTGKTTCLKALIAALEAQHKRYALASPTGRAAKRLSEATGRPASTIHRLLEFSSDAGFQTQRGKSARRGLPGGG